mgnify:CR=1 FL=1
MAHVVGGQIMKEGQEIKIGNEIYIIEKVLNDGLKLKRKEEWN